MTASSDDPDKPNTPTVDSRLVPGSMAGIERAFLKLTFWQTLLSLAGVFTGAVALYAALNESQAVREQTAASVWPYVQMIINDTDDGDSARFALSVENVGVGPARMRGISLRFAGAPVHSWDEATALLLDESVRVGVDFGRTSISKRVIAPGESIVSFATENAALARAMQRVMYSGAVSLSYCFCSIFDQCWLGDMGSGAEPQSVEACPDLGDAAFRD